MCPSPKTTLALLPPKCIHCKHMDSDADQAMELLRHSGQLSAQDAQRLLEEARGLVASGKISRCVFRVFMELIQNIRLHGAEGSASVRIYRETDGALSVETVNPASKSDAIRALARAEEAASHADSLAPLIRARRFMPHDENEAGAGLGLLEVSRLCSCALKVRENAGQAGNSELVIKARLEHKNSL